ncbi:MAG: vanadium-dependent haloperoxidase, partial [Bacteroidota bacterium]|nr:vanadium-dependent haloperoxidase [Bacteroidota bacterium]
MSAAASGNWKQKSENPEFIHRSIKQVTDVIVHDIYSPPVASRIYAYITIAGYEAAIQGNPKYISFAGQLHDLTSLPALEAAKEYSPSLAAVQAILTVGKSLVISEGQIDDFHKKILLEFKKTGMPNEVFQNSVAYGKKVAEHILAWAAKDNYKETRSYPKYAVSDEEATWKPTPPAYMRAVEPHWNKIRTFLIDSAQQFKPAPAIPFSTDKNSVFYKEAAAVRDVGSKLTPEQKDIASFWDCNPFKMNVKGHVMFATKKISPGGHWINITRLACKKANADLVQSAEAYACVSITLADSFISCWDEKYRSNVIRPETYINQYMDADWVPLLQTPPFPEYTSGHSVVSTAAALMLTRLFGEDFSFADSTEVEFGLPVRHFKSFMQAAEEAAISRFYGGIHYMPSINNGIEEGNKIGNFITQR